MKPDVKEKMVKEKVVKAVKRKAKEEEEEEGTGNPFEKAKVVKKQK